MYYKFTQEELRSICRTHLEAFERWSRIVIDQVLSKNIEPNYFFSTASNGSDFIKKDITSRAKTLMDSNPGRFPSPIDALFIEDIINILCREDLYKKYFSSFFMKMYPEGINEVRTFLKRLPPIRNKLSHTNPFSTREAEQCVCYCNDFIECFKEYFIMTGQSREFNVPQIIKVTDSFGNEYHAAEGAEVFFVNIKDTLFLNAKFSLDLTIDPSFENDDYTLQWIMNAEKRKGVEILADGKRINITVVDELIGMKVSFSCRIISKNKWHKYGNHDQQLTIYFKALPQ